MRRFGKIFLRFDRQERSSFLSVKKGVLSFHKIEDFVLMKSIDFMSLFVEKV